MHSAEQLVAEILTTAHEQLQAAKLLDVMALGEATARRQDLLFELEVEHEKVNKTPSLEMQIKEINELDRRLKEVLSTVSHVCEQIRPRSAPSVYGANGRMRRRRF
jgi:hypothetical protein